MDIGLQEVRCPTPAGSFRGDNYGAVANQQLSLMSQELFLIMTNHAQRKRPK